MNHKSIRVLYKKTDKLPEIKIINNISKLKSTIVTKNLNIIPYKKLFIVCNDKKINYNNRPNIVLTFKSIYGDLILVNIDKEKREFKSLTQDEIIWYLQDLINNSTNNISIDNRNIIKTNYEDLYEKIFEKDLNSKSINFEKTIINSLVSIELALIKLLRKEDKP